MTPHLPAERRAALDHALARVVSDLAPETPLAIELDYFRERLGEAGANEPTLPEWCLWWAEGPDDWECLLDLWAAWLGQTEPQNNRWHHLGAVWRRINEGWQKFQRRVLALFPEVVVGEREWRFPIPEYARDNPEFSFWLGQQRDIAGVHPTKWKLPYVFDHTPEGHVAVLCEIVTADRLILPEKE